MQKTVTVDFWDVYDLNDQDLDLFPIIKSAGEAPFATRMVDRGVAQKDYLVEVIEHNNTISGTAALIRIEDWPQEVDLQQGGLAALTLAANKALAEEMSFRFDRPSRVLVTQRHRLFRTSRLAKLFEGITGSRFKLQPILRSDAYQRFLQMDRIGKVELKVRGPMNPNTTGTIQSIAEAMNAARDDFHAIEITLGFSMGPVRGQSMAQPRVRQLIQRFRNHDNTKSLMVSGHQADSPAEVVDFINDRLIFSDEIEYADKHLSRAQCRQLLAASIDQNRPYLSAR
jgi:hypothetical protein